MSHWYMLTLVGKDRAGIVAKVTNALYDSDCNLGETSMIRLGGNFTIMMMVGFDGRPKQLEAIVEPVADSLGLRYHVDRIEGHLHDHIEPDVRVTVHGADRTGIVAKVTEALFEAGLHILELESDVAGSEDSPIYIMTIEGHASEGVEAVQSALDVIKEEGIETRLSVIETLIG